MALTTVQVQAADGSTYEVVGDLIGGIFYPLYKLTVGALDNAGNIVSAANPLPILIYDDNGRTAEIDPLGYLVQMDVAHHKIHEGESYTATHVFDDVAAAGTALLRILVPAGVNYHASASASTQLLAEVELLEGTTYSAPGTPVVEYNRDRTSSETSGADVFHTPTVNVAGTILQHSLIPAGNKLNFSQGSVASGREEWVLDAGTDYLIRVTNTGSQISDIGIEIDWYENAV